MRPIPVLALAATFALVGPLITRPRDGAAVAPFVYTPPEGFEPASPEVVKAAFGGADGTQKVWVHTQPGAAMTPNVTLTFTDKTAQIEDEDLRALAAGMPAVFEPLGGTYTEVHHEVRRRADGARVGVLDGALTSGGSRKRVLQVVFPLDKGAALVTVTVPEAELAQWQPKLDASIAEATGVAVRAPKAPAWLYAAWGAAGAVLAYLGLALFARPKRARES